MILDQNALSRGTRRKRTRESERETDRETQRDKETKRDREKEKEIEQSYWQTKVKETILIARRTEDRMIRNTAIIIIK